MSENEYFKIIDFLADYVPEDEEEENKERQEEIEDESTKFV